MLAVWGYLSWIEGGERVRGGGGNDGDGEVRNGAIKYSIVIGYRSFSSCRVRWCLIIQSCLSALSECCYCSVWSTGIISDRIRTFEFIGADSLNCYAIYFCGM